MSSGGVMALFLLSTKFWIVICTIVPKIHIPCPEVLVELTSFDQAAVSIVTATATANIVAPTTATLLATLIRLHCCHCLEESL